MPTIVWLNCYQGNHGFTSRLVLIIQVMILIGSWDIAWSRSIRTNNNKIKDSKWKWKYFISHIDKTRLVPLHWVSKWILKTQYQIQTQLKRKLTCVAVSMFMFETWTGLQTLAYRRCEVKNFFQRMKSELFCYENLLLIIITIRLITKKT